MRVSLAKKKHSQLVDATEDRGLHFYRCLQCLEVFTNEEFFHTTWEEIGPQKRHITNLQCICMGSIEWIGQAQPSEKKLKEKRRRSTCDNRCIKALGPDCYCCCKCRNHGVAHSAALTNKGEKTGLISKPIFSPEIHKAIIVRTNDYKALRYAVQILLRQGSLPGSAVKAAREHYNTFEELQFLMVFNQRMNKLQALHEELSPHGASFVLPSQSTPSSAPLPSQSTAATTPWAINTTISYQQNIWVLFAPDIPELTPQLLKTLAKARISKEHPLHAMLSSNIPELPDDTKTEVSATDKIMHAKSQDARAVAMQRSLNEWFT